MKENIFWVNNKEKEENKEVFEDVILEAIRKIECDGYELGRGRTAEVCGMDGRLDICVKIINTDVKPRNDAFEEMRFLDELSKDNFSAPRPLCSAKTDKAEYLFMEKIAGESSLDFIEKDMLDDFQGKFDFTNFFKKLRELISFMHSKNIYHRDLRPGNVMINLNGDPVIIDFGESKKTVISTEDPYQDVDVVRGNANIITRDEDRVNELYREMGKYLKSKGYFNR